MKRLMLTASVLVSGLAACGQNNGLTIGQGFGIDANLSGGNISVSVVQVVDTKTGVTKDYRSVYTLTQPIVTFNARPQSVGYQIQSYVVEVVDNAGVRYAADQGKYQRSTSQIVQPGFVCTQVPASTLDGCAPNSKQAANVPTAVTNLVLVTDEIGRQVTGDCQFGVCPTLKLKVTFNGVDAAGRPQSLQLAGADLIVRVTSVSVIKE